MSYKIKHAHGTIDGGYATYEEAIAAVRAVYRSAAIGHDGDIAQGGERTLCWIDDETADDDDGRRACCVISFSHEVTK